MNNYAMSMTLTILVSKIADIIDIKLIDSNIKHLLGPMI
jgi:hypothetical protein